MNIKYSKSIVVLSLLFGSLISNAQNQQLGAAMPQIIPMSPEVAGLARFSSYPVNQYTGIPDISIPLYEIKTNEFAVPIVLRYHASGIKVTDVASWVGLGWSLEAGGMINRQVCGIPDENSLALEVRNANLIYPDNDNDYNYLTHAFHRDDLDTEPDIFVYNYPGGSGRFLFYGNSQQLFIPNVPLKAKRYIRSVYRILDSLQVADQNGNSYCFKYSLSPNILYSSKKISIDPNSSWLLSKIRNANKTDSIQFSYQNAGSGYLSEDILDYINVDDYSCTSNTQCNVPLLSTMISPLLSEIVYTSGEEIVNSEIKFSSGKVTFVLSENSRLDRIHNFKSLDTIKVYSNNEPDIPIKYIVFHTSYFINGTSKRLKLDSVEVLDKDKVIIQTYSFGYNTSELLPGYSSRQKDYWGYYNGKPNLTLVPRQEISYQISCGGVPEMTWIGGETYGRDSDPSKMQAYILNTILYPTGGITEFEYQANTYDDNGITRTAGGLRIQKIKNNSGNGQLLTKTYQYGNGRLNVRLNNYFFKTESTTLQLGDDGNGCYPLLSKRSSVYASNPSIEINPIDGSPVVYQTVTEFIGDTVSNSGKIVYEFYDNPDYQRNLYGNIGAGNTPLVSTPRSYDPKIMMISRSFERGLLASKSIYKNENNIYTKVAMTENQYGAFSPKTISNIGLSVWMGDYYVNGSAGSWRSEYKYGNYEAYTGDNLLKYSAEYSFNQTSTSQYVKKETFYTYNDSTHLQLRQVKQINSDGNNHSIITKYPTDFSTGVYPEMVSKNIISTPVEEDQLIDTTYLIQTKANFKKYYQKIYAPESVEQKTGSNSWETRVRYLKYDPNGNIISVKKENNFPVSYIYDQFHQPIAEVINADTNSIYYNNFESIDGNSQIDDSKTGHRSRTGGFIIQLNEMKNGPYILNYWSKIANNWSFVSENLNINGSYLINLNGQIDDVRLYPSDAQMKTYTYEVLVGLTSSTDENNVITYYEYDSFGRLRLIRDNDGNILKTYDYHYK